MFFTICGLLLIIPTIFYFNYEKKRIVESNYKTLELASNNSQEIILNWFSERTSDAGLLYSVQLMHDEINSFIQTGNANAKDKIITHYTTFVEKYNYQNMLLLDTNAKIALSIYKKDRHINDETKNIFNPLKLTLSLSQNIIESTLFHILI